METNLIWLIIGIVLIIVEMMTGTFYLLMLGVACLAGAAAAYFGFGLLSQVLFAGLIAVIGVFGVHRWHRARRGVPGSANALDLGQAVTLDSWIDQRARLARVKYRGSLWDAEVDADETVQISDTLYIRGLDSGRLRVSPTKP